MATEERLTALEQSVRRQRQLIMLLIVGALAYWAILRIQPTLLHVAYGAEQAPLTRVYDKVRLRALEICNEKDQTIGAFRATADGCHLYLSHTAGEKGGGTQIVSGAAPLIQVNGPSKSVTLQPSSVMLTAADPQDTKKLSDIMRKSLSGQPLSPNEIMLAAELAKASRILVHISGLQNTGLVDVFNHQGNCVVRLAPNKVQGGGVYVNDQHGNISRALEGDRSR